MNMICQLATNVIRLNASKDTLLIKPTVQFQFGKKKGSYQFILTKSQKRKCRREERQRLDTTKWRD